MAIESPKEPVYYYEASHGRFRLIYHIPPEELENLSEAGKISEAVLRDYPDGVDLSCTEIDFEQFEKMYNYRPPSDPVILQKAFFAVFSGTRNWKEFRGSGFLPPVILRKSTGVVEDSMQKLGVSPVEPLTLQKSLKERRRIMTQQEKQKKRMTAHLRRIDVEGVDPKQSLRQQNFPAIPMREGKSAAEVFTKLLRRQKEDIG